MFILIVAIIKIATTQTNEQAKKENNIESKYMVYYIAPIEYMKNYS